MKIVISISVISTQVIRAPFISVEESSQVENAGDYLVSLSGETEGASIGYRFCPVNSPLTQRWGIYAGAFWANPGDTVEAKAVPYGWAESEVVALELP